MHETNAAEGHLMEYIIDAPGELYQKVYVTENGGLGIQVGGRVVVRSPLAWMYLLECAEETLVRLERLRDALR